MHIGRKTTAISMRIDPAVRDAMWALADHEHRSVANLVEVLVIEKCRALGIPVTIASYAERHAKGEEDAG